METEALFTNQLHVNITLSPSMITDKSMSLFPSAHTQPLP